MDSRRLERVAQTYYHEISQLLLLELDDPKLSGVSITRVRLTPDLRLARVYFDIHDGGKERTREVLKGFRRSKGFLKKELAARVRLRFTPELEFHYDEAQDLTNQVEDIFKKLDNEKNEQCNE